MKDDKILESLKRSVDQAPIDILDNIKNENVVKMMRHDDITRQEKKRNLKPLMSFASIAAVFLLVFFNFQQVRLPEDEIYLDVNPGIHLTTNRKDEVINLEGINAEAREIVREIDYKNRNVDDITEEILEYLVDKSYIEDQDEIMLVSVYNRDRDEGRQKANHLNQLIHNKLDEENLSPIILTQALEESNTVEDFANRYGISIGKMTFIRNMIILNPELETEDLVDLSLRELIELSRERGIDIESIIEGSDMDRIPEQEPEAQPAPEPDPEPTPVQPSLIGEERARTIALGIANGRIVDFELDWDDGRPEYKFEIITDNFEYEIEVDGYTGEVLDVDRDEIDDDYDDD